MGLYLGNSEKLQIVTTINSISGVCNLFIPSVNPITNGMKLISSDNFILKDSNGIYLTTKEDN